MANLFSQRFNSSEDIEFIEDFEEELLAILNNEQKYTFQRAYKIPAGESDSGETLYYLADFYAKELNLVIELEIKFPKKDEMQRFLRNALLSKNQFRIVILSDEFLVPEVAAYAIMQVIRQVLLSLPGKEVQHDIN